ncbi:MAG: EF-hand domain-containing protein [Lentisphaerae bacterium]|nr:EF-hand domain-containing protein [Lentisphaerota bacterium]
MDKRMGLTLAMAAAMMLGGKVFAANGPGGDHKHKGMNPEERFAKMDADGDGSVTRDEFMTAHKAWAEKKFEKRGEEGNFEEAFAKRTEKLGERFDTLDADHNGSLTKEEFKAGAPKHDGEGKRGPKGHGQGPAGDAKEDADDAPEAN